MAEHLRRHGYRIVYRNWKTRVCEIDIVARKPDAVYFVEVKYRSGEAQGGGFEYIAGRKLQRMRFAAEVWCQHHGYTGDCRLLAAAVSGPTAGSIELTEID